MKEKLNAALQEGMAKITAATTESELNEIKAALLGKSGAVTELMKEIPKLDVSLRPEMGKEINRVKNALSEAIDATREAIKLKASEVGSDFDCTLPGILPTVIITFLLQVGRLMNLGYTKILLLQNDLNLEVSTVISTYTYEIGLLGGQYSYSSAIGLFNNIVNITVLLIANYISRKVSETSLV